MADQVTAGLGNLENRVDALHRLILGAAAASGMSAVTSPTAQGDPHLDGYHAGLVDAWELMVAGNRPTQTPPGVRPYRGTTGRRK